MVKRYGASAGVCAIQPVTVASGMASSSGVNQAVAVANLAKAAPTRWKRPATAWSRVSTSRCSCG